MRKTRTLLCALAGVVYFSSAGATEPAAGETTAAENAPIDGLWTEHRYAFTHLGGTSTYSCDGLADKLTLLLRAAGARADIVASPAGCAGGFGRPDRLARVNLRFYTLRPAAGVAAATPVVAGAPPPVPVPGVWKAVQLERRMPRQLGDGDCELVEEFRDFVLPMFATRAVRDSLRCIPQQVSGADLRLGFETFVPAEAAVATRAGTTS